MIVRLLTCAALAAALSGCAESKSAVTVLYKVGALAWALSHQEFAVDAQVSAPVVVIPAVPDCRLAGFSTPSQKVPDTLPPA